MAEEISIDHIADTIRKAVQDAYERGREDGARDVRNAILKAANIHRLPTEGGPITDALNKANESSSDTKNSRAPRGLVTDTVTRLLNQKPGQTVKQLEDVIAKTEERIAVKSVGNTLRRLQSIRYFRDGDRWYTTPVPKRNSSEGPAANEPPDELSDLLG